jgi:hypothetical protein
MRTHARTRTHAQEQTAYGLRSTVYGLRLTVYGLRFTVYGLRCMVYGVRFEKHCPRLQSGGFNFHPIGIPWCTLPVGDPAAARGVRRRVCVGGAAHITAAHGGSVMLA